MRLLLVRHGDPNYELDCLTELGHRQAKIVAKRLMEEGIQKIYCSPQGRAQQTAVLKCPGGVGSHMSSQSEGLQVL